MLSVLSAILAVTEEVVKEEHAVASVSLISVYILGFVAAAGLGSLAWYNSKRPTGWEDKERPPIVPEIDKEETPGIGEPMS